MNKIDFTVVIPVYNTEPAHLMECVYSVINQSIKQKFNIYIMDDGSTDVRTLGVIQYFSVHPYITVVRQVRNGGISTVLNKAHEIIKTDLFHPNKLENQVAWLEENPQCDVCSTQLFSFKDKDMQRRPLITTQHALKTKPLRPGAWWIANHGTVIYKNQKVKDAGGYDITKRREQDVDLWKRMYEMGCQFYCLPQVHYAWRKD
jgi:hypothetical protein